MPAKKKEREISWDEIGKAIGTKMEKHKDIPWKKQWMCNPHQNGGGFGRLLFAIGLVFAFEYAGLLGGIPAWTLVMIVIGFAMMRL